MKAKETTMVIDYKSSIGEFLDIKGIKWSSISIDQVGDLISIYFGKQMSAEELFQFAMDYRDFLETTY